MGKHDVTGITRAIDALVCTESCTTLALGELDVLRESLLAYDAAADTSGDRWDALRIALDRQLLAIRFRLEQATQVEEIARQVIVGGMPGGGTA